MVFKLKWQYESHHAVWVPCAGYSLNLVGQAAAECCQAAVAFFYFLEAIYMFFTVSTQRHEILTDSPKTVESGPISVPESVSTTRWSCRSDALKAIVQGYHPIREENTRFLFDFLCELDLFDKLLMNKKVADTFPNVEIMLRMCLVIVVPNCSGERSFSKLKFIKNRLRTTMSHDRLSHLALMSIEYDIFREIDQRLRKNQVS